MKKNIIANIIGKFWSILSNFLFIPLYIKYLGIEGYSIISYALVVAGVLAVLDAGLTATLSREFAKKNISSLEKNKVLGTIESCYFIIVIFIILFLLVFSNYIASNMLILDAIDSTNVALYIKIIGIEIGFQLLLKLYLGGLLGLEHQIKANVYQVAWGIVRNALVVVLLMYIPSLEAFFIWQCSSTIIFALLLRRSLYKTLNNKSSFTFFFTKIDSNILKSIWKFAGGMLLISLVAALNTQLDKLIIGKLFSIENLGYYMLAVALAQGVVILVNPISVATLPRFTAYYSEENVLQADDLFHKIFLPISIVVFSISAVLIVNAEQILWMWTGDKSLASNAAPFVPYITIAYTMMALAIIPFNIAIANAYTRLNNYLGIFGLVIIIPGYWIAIKLMGPVGASVVFCIVQSITTIIYLYIINRKFLITKKIIHIYLKEMLFPSLIAFTIVWVLSYITFFDSSRITSFVWICITTIITISISIGIMIPIKNIISFIKPNRFIE